MPRYLHIPHTPDTARRLMGQSIRGEITLNP